MSERTTIGGTSYESIGSSSSNLLLKCNGTARIQWGNKLIDLIKDGKLAIKSSNNLFLKGMIVLFPTTEQIPEGWAICDGEEHTYKNVTSKTPNLMDNNFESTVFIMKL